MDWHNSLSFFNGMLSMCILMWTFRLQEERNNAQLLIFTIIAFIMTIISRLMGG